MFLSKEEKLLKTMLFKCDGVEPVLKVPPATSNRYFEELLCAMSPTVAQSLIADVMSKLTPKTISADKEAYSFRDLEYKGKKKSR